MVAFWQLINWGEAWISYLRNPHLLEHLNTKYNNSIIIYFIITVHGGTGSTYIHNISRLEDQLEIIYVQFIFY